MVWLCPGTACTNQVHGCDLCDDCIAFLPELLERIEVLWLRARLLLPRGRGDSRERVSSTVVGSQAPLSVRVLDELDGATTKLNVWANVLRVRRTERAISESLSGSVTYLVCHYKDLCGTQLATDFFNALYRQHRSLHEIAGDTPDLGRLRQPCPRCNNLTLVQRRRDDYIRCLTCSGTWGQAAYLALSRR